MRKNHVNQASRPDQILIVEDETLVAWDFEQSLREIGFYNIDKFSTLSEASSALMNDATNYQLVLLDIKLPDGDGTELIPMCIAKFIPVLVITGYSDFRDARVRTIYKPYTSVEFVSMVLSLTGSRT